MSRPKSEGERESALLRPCVYGALRPIREGCGLVRREPAVPHSQSKYSWTEINLLLKYSVLVFKFNKNWLIKKHVINEIE